MKPTIFVKTLLNSSRNHKRTMTGAPLFAVGVSLAMIQYAGATDYQYGATTGNFSTGFTPTLSGGLATTSDKLVFPGAEGVYTATDDLTGITVNAVRYTNTGTGAIKLVTVARGAGDNLITLGQAPLPSPAGTPPTLELGNVGFGGVNDSLDYTFSVDGYVTKTNALNGPAANPVFNGAFKLDGLVNFAMRDTGGDALPEIRLNGVVTGAGGLTVNNQNIIGSGSPGAGTDSWGTLFVAGSNPGLSGPVSILRGRIVVNKDDALGTGPLTIGGPVNGGGVLSIGGSQYPGGGQNYGVIAAGGGITLHNTPISLGGQTAASDNYKSGLYNSSGTNTLTGEVTLQQALVSLAIHNLSTLTMSNKVKELSVGLASIEKIGNGTLVMHDASFTGTASVVRDGNVAFTGLALAGGTFNVISPGALNVGGAGASYAGPNSLVSTGRVAAASTGIIALSGASSEATSFVGYPDLALGATVAGGDFSGTFAPDTTSNRYKLGGGGGELTVSGTNTLTGAASVQVVNGNVTLAGTNNYTGGTTLTNNTLTLGAAGALGSVGNISLTGGTLKFTAANTTDYSNRFAFGPSFNGQQYNFNTNGQNVTFASAFGSSGGVINKSGAGTLTLGDGVGSPIFNPIGAVNVNAGGLTIAASASLLTAGTASPLPVTNGNFVVANANTTVAGTLTVGGELQMGQGAGNTAVNTLPTGGAITANSWMQVGRGGGTGTLNITGGTLSKTGGQPIVVGDRAGAASNGTVNISSGSINQTGAGQFWIGQNSNDAAVARATGTVNLSGGSITTNSWLAVGREGGIGTLNISGGTFTKQGTDHTEIGGSSGATGLVNVTGGFFIGNGETRLGLSTAGSGTLTVSGSGFVDVGVVKLAFLNTGNGTINLNTGGIMSVTRIEKSTAGNGIVNFDGGTLVAKVAEVNFMTGLTSANINGSGAIIDTISNDVTIAQNLLAGTGSGGLTKIGSGKLTLTGLGTNYTGATVVSDGILSLPAPFLADASAVTIDSIGVLDLNYVGTDTIGSLTIDGNVIPAGTTVDSVSHPFLITGTGKLFVAGGSPVSGYDAFVTANSLTGPDAAGTADPDFDGIKNLLEFVFGGDPVGAGAANTSILPTVTQDATSLTVSFKRMNDAQADVPLVLKVQWSADLVTWGSPKEVTIPASDTGAGIVGIAANSPTPDRDTITVTIPKTGNEVGQKLFARVIAVR